MKILLTVLMHHQEQYAERMAAAIAAQTRSPDHILVMLDRPDAKEIIDTRKAFAGLEHAEILSVHAVPEYVGRPQMNPGVEQFCSGELRNRAVRYAATHEYGGIVFIDGDSLPGTELVASHTRIFETEGVCATVGRRNEVKHGFRDQRESYGARLIPIFRNLPYRVTEEAFFVDSGVVWTCNFGITMDAAKRLTEINTELFGRAEAFSTDFTGTWGGEDGYIGFQCLYGGIPVYTLPEPESGILHIEHPRPIEKYDHLTFISYLEAKRIELMHLLAHSRFGTNGYELRDRAEIIGDREWNKQYDKG